MAKIKNPFSSKSDKPKDRTRVVFTVDNSRTTRLNEKHWANADALRADKANIPGVRKILRDRGNYEVINNSYAAGIVSTLAMDTVGTGPKLQLSFGEERVGKSVSDIAEQAWSDWANEVNLAEKLEVAVKAVAAEGEAFFKVVNNNSIPNAVTIDIQEIPCSKVSAPNFSGSDYNIDGVMIDQLGNPIAYQIVNDMDFTYEYETVPARDMLHLFLKQNPTQHRGIPEITPALDLFGQLRRYTKAVLTAAETIADNAMVYETDGLASEDIVEIDENSLITLEPGTVGVAPMGWRLAQPDPKQPMANYPDFKREIIAEACRVFNMPLSVALGSSAGMNYASGRLDIKSYQRRLKVRRKQIETVILNPLVNRFLELAAYVIPGLEPLQIENISKIRRSFYWTEEEHVDPKKEADAAVVLKNAGLETDSNYYARKGMDWRDAYAQLAKEKQMREELGIQITTPEAGAGQGEQDNGDETDE